MSNLVNVLCMNTTVGKAIVIFLRNPLKCLSKICLLLAASSMCLCCAEDADLIRGTCAVNKQTVFMEQLLDMVCLMDSSLDPIARSMHSPGHVSGLSIDEQYHHDCHLLDTLAAGGAQTSVHSMFTSQPKLLPPDIVKHLGSLKHNQEGNVVPDLSDLMTRAEQMARDLQKHQDQLATLHAMHRPPGPRDAAQMHRVHSTVRVVLTELHQILTGFSTCFETELRPWCHRNAPQVSQLGPVCKRVHVLLTHFSQMLSDLGEIQSSYRSLSDDIQDRVKKITHQLNQPADGTMDTKPFQECVEVLEESIVRLDSSLNSSIRSGITLSTITPATSD